MLRIRLLGGFQVERDGVALTAFHSQKAQSLFAYLTIYRDRAHPRSVLATLFWGESDETRAQANLRNALYSLRHTIEGPDGRCRRYLLAEGSAVRFNEQSEYSLDVQEFEEKLEAAHDASGPEHAALLEEAVGLYQGDLLPGFYDDWVVIEQEHLRELHLHALKALAAHHAEQQDYPHAIEWARRALTENPLQEDLHRALMQLYALVGNRSAALQQYAECAAILQRELAATPLPETHALYQRLATGRSLETTPPSELPSEIPFVGRERELEALNQLWHQVHRGQGQAVFIGGEVGVGKTSFVQRFIAHIQRPPSQPLPASGRGAEGRKGFCILQGAAYASGHNLPYHPLLQAVRAGLKSLSPQTLAQLPALWRSELAQFVPELQDKFPDLKPNPPLPPAKGRARWFAALTEFFGLLTREHPTILFLDDLHWADDATLECLGYLVSHLKDFKILLIGTYRAEEALEGSRLRRWLDKLGPGRAYHPLVLPRLSKEETEMLLERLVGVGAQHAVSLLYHETEGNPLFLTELARSLVQSGALLQDQEGCWQLVTEEISPAHWPENLREMIEASLRRAPTRAQNLLGPMAVIGHTTELPMLREMLHQPEEKLLDRLDELCKARVIVEREGQYQFHHEVIRQVVYEGLSADRKKLWHKKVGEALELLYPDRLDELSEQLMEHFAHAQQLEKATVYAVRAGTRAQKIYANNEALKLFTRAQQLFQKLEARQPLSVRFRKLKLELLARYTSLFPTIYDITSSDLQAAISQMLTLASEMRDKARLCEAYKRQAWLQVAQGQGEVAKATLQQALEVARTLPDASTASVLDELGNVHAQLREYSQALEYYQQALEAWTALDDRGHQGCARKSIAEMRMYLGQLKEAQQDLKQALELLADAGDLHSQAGTLNSLAAVYCKLNQLPDAQACYERAHQLLLKLGEPRGLCIVLLNLGLLQNDQGHYTEALGYFERVLEMISSVGLKGPEITALFGKAVAHLRRHELTLALDCSTRATSILEAHQGILMQAQSYYYSHSQILQANGKPNEAQLYLRKAHEEVQRMASQIADEVLRKSFLENVQINRDIVQAWEAAQQKEQST